MAKTADRKLVRYADLSDALKDNDHRYLEWRAHFHVPVFAKNFGLLSSTRDEIIEVLSLQKMKPFTKHLEVETYTWEVLPPELKLPLQDSIIRELQWQKISWINDGSKLNDHEKNSCYRCGRPFSFINRRTDAFFKTLHP